MKYNQRIKLTGVTFAVIVAIIVAISVSKPAPSTSTIRREEVIIPQDQVNEEVNTKTGVMVTEEETQKAHGIFVDYDSALLTNANNGSVVLFFWAGWCPTCQALERNLNAEIDQFPADLTILRTNYDSETALIQKYGVSYQHTLVQIDAKGNLIKKWSGSYNLSDILKQLI